MHLDALKAHSRQDKGGYNSDGQGQVEQHWARGGDFDQKSIDTENFQQRSRDEQGTKCTTSRTGQDQLVQRARPGQGRAEQGGADPARARETSKGRIKDEHKGRSRDCEQMQLP